MAAASQYLEDQVMNWLKGSTFASAPTTVYVALFTTAPSDDAGTSAVEVSGGSYARVSITTSTGWSSISGAPSAAAQISNSGTLTFATPTGNWGTIVAFGIYDASSSGNLLLWNTVSSQVVNTGVVVSFAAGALVITID